MARSLLAVMAAGLTKAVVPATTVPSYAVQTASRWGFIREPFSGAWQRDVVVDPTESILAFSAVYACIDLISSDIAKLRPKLMQAIVGNVTQEVTNAAYSPVLRKPNHYQTRIQFLQQWIAYKLIHGNSYILKERDNRGSPGKGVVIGLHVLNPTLVKALIAENGEVFYSISGDRLALTQSITVPASEIIHDRCVCLYHPLVGIPPIFACGISSTQGNRIQANSAKFFENMSRPSGMLTAPDVIDDETALRLKVDFEANFSGNNLGRLLVGGDGLKYEPMTIPAQQAQMIEQLKWTVEDVARAFHVPLHKLGADSGVKFNNMASMNEDYYTQTLQKHIEDIELGYDEGLSLAGDGNQVLGVELDLESLLRMDPAQRAERNAAAVKGGYWAPNEARQTDNLPPVAGGDTPLMQQQWFPLDVLAKQPPPGSMPPAPPAPAAAAPAPAPEPGKGMQEIADDLFERLGTQHTADVSEIKSLIDGAREVLNAQTTEAARLAEESERLSTERADLVKQAASAPGEIAQIIDERMRAHLETIQERAAVAIERETKVEVRMAELGERIDKVLEARVEEPKVDTDALMADELKAFADDLIGKFASAEHAG